MIAAILKGAVLPLLRITVAVFVGLCLVLYLFQNRLIFHPQPLADGVRRATRALSGVTELELVATDGTRLAGWLRHTADPAPGALLIYFGGNAEEVSGQMLDALQLTPWSMATFNYRGYGLSEGGPSQTDLNADALAIYDALAAREDIDPQRIVIMGRSLGTGVAVHLAANRPVHAALLVSPFDSLRSIAQKQYPFVPVSLMLRHSFDSIASAPGITAPLLVLAGAHDQLIPATHSRRLFDAWAGPKHWELIPAVGHNDIHNGPRYWPAMREFLEPLR